MKKIVYLSSILFSLLLTNCSQSQTTDSKKSESKTKSNNYPDPQKISANAQFPIHFSENEWKQKLTPAQYYILREKGTERAFTGKYNHFYKKGTYYSAATLQPLFSSDTKFDSGTGWPSFSQPIKENAIAYYLDNSLGMARVETICNTCDAHLGHVFPDGPGKSGLRYCMNAVALQKVK